MAWDRVEALSGPANRLNGRWVVCKHDGRWAIFDQRTRTYGAERFRRLVDGKAWLADAAHRGVL